MLRFWFICQVLIKDKMERQHTRLSLNNLKVVSPFYLLSLFNCIKITLLKMTKCLNTTKIFLSKKVTKQRQNTYNPIRSHSISPLPSVVSPCWLWLWIYDERPSFLGKDGWMVLSVDLWVAEVWHIKWAWVLRINFS